VTGSRSYGSRPSPKRPYALAAAARRCSSSTFGSSGVTKTLARVRISSNAMPPSRHAISSTGEIEMGCIVEARAAPLAARLASSRPGVAPRRP